MFEEYIGKKVKLRVKVGEEVLTFTGIIKETSETHIKLLDIFSEEHLFSKENIEQATLQEAEP
jgi:ribosome maturation factor RimP